MEWITITLFFVMLVTIILLIFFKNKDTKVLSGIGVVGVAAMMGVSGAVIDIQATPTLNFDYVCNLTDVVNTTLSGYKTVYHDVTSSSTTCQESLLPNGTTQCIYTYTTKQVGNQVPQYTNNIIQVCKKEDRTKLFIDKPNKIDIVIDVVGSTSSINNNVITIKNISQGASWNDGMPDECWHPQVSCEQINLNNNKIITSVRP